MYNLQSRVYFQKKSRDQVNEIIDQGSQKVSIEIWVRVAKSNLKIPTRFQDINKMQTPRSRMHRECKVGSYSCTRFFLVCLTIKLKYIIIQYKF